MIVDCVMYAYEADALAVRTAELAGVVDLRVIVQGTETFRGQPLEPLKRPAGGPTPTVVERLDFGLVTDPWQREYMLRQFSLEQGRAHSRTGARLLLADADEIPHPDAIKTAATLKHPALLPVDMREWWMDWRVPDDWQPPHQPLLGRWENYFGAGGAQGARAAFSWPEIGPRGWHLSTLGDSALASTKLAAFAHSEYDTPEHNSAAVLSERRAGGRDILDRFPLTLTDDLPACANDFPHLLAYGAINAS